MPVPVGSSDGDDHLVITPLFVYNELRKHTDDCAKRWWAVMAAVVSSAVVLISGMAGLIVTLVLRTAH